MKRNFRGWPVACGLMIVVGACTAQASTILPGIQATASASAGESGDHITNVEIGDPSLLTVNQGWVAGTGLPLLATAAGASSESCNGTGSAAASVADITEPAVLASAGAEGGDNMCAGTGQAEATLKYAFEVVGSGPDSNVPVLFQGNNSTFLNSCSSDGFVCISSFGLDEIQDSSGDDLVFNEQGGNYNQSIQIVPGALYYVYLQASVDVGSQTTSAFASASADPTLTIDPSFADAGDFSIVYSPDLTQAQAPEPAGIWLLATGLALLTLKRTAPNAAHMVRKLDPRK